MKTIRVLVYANGKSAIANNMFSAGSIVFEKNADVTKHRRKIWHLIMVVRGRLASCFLDSMTTLNLRAWWYELRYKYRLFKQRISKARQEELVKDAAAVGHVWMLCFALKLQFKESKSKLNVGQNPSGVLGLICKSIRIVV
ncbi:hypothetical protein E3N88_12923 [Mikania micrantha]|uniref:Alpha-1,4 glucan phosphorylase n=1 Tax=Mikania micrantha TaxID=192012 RepID=A0A5N6P8W3_9ASTR|nr:hypothetical protein E3N88_12923 [Mikania micrantha]